MANNVLANEKITLGGGCFWCLDAVYSGMKGVQNTVSGYANGNTKNPTYKDVSHGNTGYVEVVQIEFDSKVVSLEKILEVFWNIHDPTTPNRQGADVGTQYRSAILYENEAQKQIIVKSEEEAQKKFEAKIITQIEPLKNFYKAEEYHQKYFAKNPNQGYCQVVVAPKVDKFRKKFGENIKK